jgi:hypothetical protein
MSATQALNNNTLHPRYVGTNGVETTGVLSCDVWSACPLYPRKRTCAVHKFCIEQKRGRPLGLFISLFERDRRALRYSRFGLIFATKTDSCWMQPLRSM